jgi:hypothetical protein
VFVSWRSAGKDSHRRRCGNGGKAGAVFAEAFPNSLWKSSRRSCRRPPLPISTAVAVSTTRAVSLRNESLEEKVGHAQYRPEERSPFIDDFKGKSFSPGPGFDPFHQ